MSAQSVAWMRHTQHYLRGVDPALSAMFDQAMTRAGFPSVSAAEALEAILADFLAGAELGQEITQLKAHIFRLERAATPTDN